jgi:hypothetical protein
MEKISKIEKEELLRIAYSSSVKEDMNHLSNSRYNPVMVNGNVCLDSLISFLTQFNQFINHKRKSFRPTVEKVMKL